MSIHDHAADDIQLIEGYDSFDSDNIDYDTSLNTALVVFNSTLEERRDLQTMPSWNTRRGRTC